jgi:hypothetical protein
MYSIRTVPRFLTWSFRRLSCTILGSTCTYTVCIYASQSHQYQHSVALWLFHPRIASVHRYQHLFAILLVVYECLHEFSAHLVLLLGTPTIEGGQSVNITNQSRAFEKDQVLIQ